MMGLVLKESHRSWGFPIGVNTQHTSSVSSFSQHRWVLEALGRKVLIWECSLRACSCVGGCHHLKNSSVKFSPCRPHMLLPRTELLGLLVYLWFFNVTWADWAMGRSPILRQYYEASLKLHVYPTCLVVLIWKWWPGGMESSSSRRLEALLSRAE